MGFSVFPEASSGGIKSVQRGEALTSGNITISSVNTSKAFVKSFGTGSSGSVGISWGGPTQGTQVNQTIDYGTGFVFGSYGVYLSNSTTLVATGPCRWEVVEFA